MILWKRSEEEWDAIVEALEDKLEEEHDKRLMAEERVEELDRRLEALVGRLAAPERAEQPQGSNEHEKPDRVRNSDYQRERGSLRIA